MTANYLLMYFQLHISFIDKGYLFMILTSLRLNFLFDSLTFPFLRNRWHIENSKKVYSQVSIKRAGCIKQVGCRDVSTGATGATAVAPKFSDTLTLSPPGGGADSAHHCRGRI